MELRSKIAAHFDCHVDKLKLHRPTLILHVHLDSHYHPISRGAYYYMGGIFVALVALLTGKQARTDTAILGDISPTGSLCYYSEWCEEDVMLAKASKIRRVILANGTKGSAEAQHLADVLHPDGRPWLEIIHESLVSKTLQHCF